MAAYRGHRTGGPRGTGGWWWCVGEDSCRGGRDLTALDILPATRGYHQWDSMRDHVLPPRYPEKCCLPSWKFHRFSFCSIPVCRSSANEESRLSRYYRIFIQVLSSFLVSSSFIKSRVERQYAYPNLPKIHVPEASWHASEILMRWRTILESGSVQSINTSNKNVKNIVWYNGTI